MDAVQRVETADGLNLHVLTDGPVDGQPVILIHGWPDTHHVWRHQVPALAEAGHRVITYDQRGFGQSDRPADVAGYHVFHAMADITAVLDHFDLPSAHLVGHDWGSPPCWLAATLSPERVRSLTSLSVGHPLAFRDAGLEQRRRSFYMLLFQFVDIAEQWLMADDWANMLTLIHNPPDWVDRKTELSKPGALTSSLNWYRANAHPSSWIEPPADLPPVDVPTMGVMGANDWALTETQMINSAAHVAGDFRYEVIPDAAHWLQTEQPDALNALLLDWITNNG